MAEADITELLQRWKQGDPAALEKLTAIVYAELRRIAQRYLKDERHAQTMQSTVLVHEAYIRLAGVQGMDWQNRAHFYHVAARLIRNILVDHARTRSAGKRGAGAVKLDLSSAENVPLEGNLVALDDALASLAKLNAEQAKIVELRYFAGLSIPETAEAMEISESTVKRGWVLAKTFLRRELERRT